MPFDPKKGIIRVQGGREYLPAASRITWFRQDHPDHGIVTSIVEINFTPPNNRPPYAIFMAQIFTPDGRLIACGHKYEDVKGFPDFIEKAEKGSVARALGMCGYGTDDALGVDDSDRLADAPPQQAPHPAPSAALQDARNARQEFARAARKIGCDVAMDNDKTKADAQKITNLYNHFIENPMKEIAADSDYTPSGEDWRTAQETMLDCAAKAEEAEEAAKGAESAPIPAAFQPEPTGPLTDTGMFDGPEVGAGPPEAAQSYTDHETGRGRGRAR